jgi:hypothetical protein
MSQKRARANREKVELSEHYEGVPRGERRRRVREIYKGVWKDIFVPAGSNRKMRRSNR